MIQQIGKPYPRFKLIDKSVSFRENPGIRLDCAPDESQGIVLSLRHPFEDSITISVTTLQTMLAYTYNTARYNALRDAKRKLDEVFNPLLLLICLQDQEQVSLLLLLDYSS